MKDIRGLKDWVEAFDRLVVGSDDVEVMIEFAKEDPAEEGALDKLYAKIVNDLEALELKNMLSDEE